MRPPAALVFDFDGLILDTETPEFQAWQAIYGRHGHELTAQTWGQAVGTFGGFDPARNLEDLTGEKLDLTALRAEQHAKVVEAAAKSGPLPGVRDLLARAREAGLPCAVASSSERAWVEPWLERLGLLGAFEFTRCRDDVERVKPAPDLYLAAVEALGVKPEDALALEDSPNGARAALAAGMRVLVVKNPATAPLEFPEGLHYAPSLVGLDLRAPGA